MNCRQLSSCRRRVSTCCPCHGDLPCEARQGPAGGTPSPLRPLPCSHTLPLPAYLPAAATRWPLMPVQLQERPDSAVCWQELPHPRVTALHLPSLLSFFGVCWPLHLCRLVTPTAMKVVALLNSGSLLPAGPATGRSCGEMVNRRQLALSSLLCLPSRRPAKGSVAGLLAPIDASPSPACTSLDAVARW